MYLGLDVSTRRVGIALLDEKENIKFSTSLKFKEKISLEQRASIFEHVLQEVYADSKISKQKIKKVFVEEPFINITGGAGQAKTTAVLQRFNGMASFVVYKIFGFEPILINPRSARAKLGIKIPRGVKTTHEKKRPIIEYISKKYIDFTYELTPKGNPKPGTDDKADAIVLCLYGMKIS